MKGGQQPTFPKREHGAARMGLAEEIRGIDCGSIKIPWGNVRNAQMLQPDRQVFRCGRGIIREEEERDPGLHQCGDELGRPRDQTVLPVNDTVHVDQITCFQFDMPSLQSCVIFS